MTKQKFILRFNLLNLLFAMTAIGAITFGILQRHELNSKTKQFQVERLQFQELINRNAIESARMKRDLVELMRLRESNSQQEFDRTAGEMDFIRNQPSSQNEETDQ